MNPSITSFVAELRNRPAEVYAGLCVFFVAIMGTSVNHVASISYSFLLLAGLFNVHRWLATWRSLSEGERWLLYGFALYAFSGVLAVINVDDMQEYIKDIERYLRFLLAIPMYLFLRMYHVRAIRFLYAGAIFSGPFLLAVALMSWHEAPDQPARGYYHHIIFGSLAMLNVGVMLALLLRTKMNMAARIVIVISMLMGFTAAILSQSRGVWLVIPVYALLAMVVTWRQSRKRFAVIVVFISVFAVVAALSPLGKLVEERVQTAVDEISTYYERDIYATSVGQRLVMWEVAVELWKENPLIGIGPGDFDDVIRELQQKGQYIGMEVHASTHNIFMQALVNTGLFGLVMLCLALFYLPARLMRTRVDGDHTLRLLGANILLLFAVIGISESWILRLPTVSVYIIFVIIVIAQVFNSQMAADGGPGERS